MTTNEYYFFQELLAEVAGLKKKIADQLTINTALKADIEKLRGEVAYLDSIKDPLRDNGGWSPASDLTFD